MTGARKRVHTEAEEELLRYVAEMPYRAKNGVIDRLFVFDSLVNDFVEVNTKNKGGS